MAETTILVPIRYPLTEQSTQTLATAGRLTHEHAPADLTVLHVNLYQKGKKTKERDLRKAVSSTLGGVEASVTVRQGYLVEEVILKEATQLGADIIVIGANQQAAWRKILNRVLRNGLEISLFLRENATAGTEIVEVGAAAESPIVKPV